MKQSKLLLGLFAIFLILIVGCSNLKDGENNLQDDFKPTGEVKEFDIVAKQWEYVPNTINVNLGDKVVLHIESVDVSHGFMLPEFGINERIDPRKDMHVEFIADKKGIFTFACSVPCGRGHGGMRGTLIIE